MYYKLFRLEALVTYEDEKKIEKKAAVVQFPRSTVTAALLFFLSMWRMLKAYSPL
jgi:hypothetical protein